jgi:hypothetical protein
VVLKGSGMWRQARAHRTRTLSRLLFTASKGSNLLLVPPSTAACALRRDQGSTAIGTSACVSLHKLNCSNDRHTPTYTHVVDTKQHHQ